MEKPKYHKGTEQIKNIYELFSRWTLCKDALPEQPGWYNVSVSCDNAPWWYKMSYFDGQNWWCKPLNPLAAFGKQSTAVKVSVLRWQGLNRPCSQALAVLKRSQPKTPHQKELFQKYITFLSAPVEPLEILPSQECPAW